MTHKELLEDVRKLVGLQLESVKPGSGLTIMSVDTERGSLQLRSASGQVKSRPLDELKRIWDELQKTPAVHVDKVLNGSGTSRNQPETILANLPYIEWAKIHNKKHLVFVKEKTHAYGTLRQMDDNSSAKLSLLIDEYHENLDISVIVISGCLKSTIESFQNECGGAINSIEQGVYAIESKKSRIIFTTPEQSRLECGTYPVISAYNPSQKGTIISILGEEYAYFEINEFKFLTKK